MKYLIILILCVACGSDDQPKTNSKPNISPLEEDFHPIATPTPSSEVL